MCYFDDSVLPNQNVPREPRRRSKKQSPACSIGVLAFSDVFFLVPLIFPCPKASRAGIIMLNVHFSLNSQKSSLPRERRVEDRLLMRRRRDSDVLLLLLRLRRVL